MDTARLTAPVLGRIAIHTAGILPTDAEEMLCARLEPVLGGWAAHSRVRLTRLTVLGLVRPVVRSGSRRRHPSCRLPNPGGSLVTRCVRRPPSRSTRPVEVAFAPWQTAAEAIAVPLWHNDRDTRHSR